MRSITWLAKKQYRLHGRVLIWGWLGPRITIGHPAEPRQMNRSLKCLIRWSPNMVAGVLDCVLIGCAIRVTHGITSGYGVFTRGWAWTYPEELRSASPRCREFRSLPRPKPTRCGPWTLCTTPCITADLLGPSMSLMNPTARSWLLKSTLACQQPE